MTAPRNANARRAPGEGGQAGTTNSAESSTPIADRGRRRYLVHMLFLGLLSPERVADAVRREIEQEGAIRDKQSVTHRRADK